MGYFWTPDWFVDVNMKEMTDGELRVLIFLIRHSNGKGESWFSQIKIAESAGISKSSVIRALNSMENNKWISSKKRHRKSTIWKLHHSFLECPL